jgi:TolB-like protein
MMPGALLILWLLAASGLSPASDPPSASVVPDNRKTVAVLNFDNRSGDSQYDALGKGLASMMITDLSEVEAIQLVERERLGQLITEIDLQQTRHFDPATAARVGRFVGAEFVVTGTVVALQPSIRIDTHVVRVETAEIVKTAQVTGREDRFFDLQRRLSEALIDGLEVALSPEEWERFHAQQERNRIEELRISVQYSQALDLYDRGEYLDAAERMYQVMQAAPNSLVLQLTYEQMRRRGAQQGRRRAGDAVRGLLRGRIP